jgi:hypothetical protein
MSSTYFEPEGSSSGRRLYVQYGYICFACIDISSLDDERVCSVQMCNLLELNHPEQAGNTIRH